MQYGTRHSATRHSPNPSYSSSVSSSSNSSSTSVTASASTSSSMSAASRASSGSARSPRHRNQVNLSTIEKSITHLLVATKQLLETLTAWSRQQATEAEVSDVYVRLGSEFNIACRALTAIGVETADLGNVPDALRTILENTLSQEASVASLDVYLPSIREIIINLLHGLKRKQQRLRQRQAREAGDGSGSGPDRGSGGSSSRKRSTDANGDEAPPRTSSLPGGPAPRDSPPMQTTRESISSTTGSARHRQSNATTTTAGTAAITTEPNLPYPTVDEPDPPSQFVAPPPPPVPATQDALTALQQHSSLERRASRRYSAYQIAKLTGKSPNDVPVLPSRDPTTVPRNRESMDAVRKRSSAARSRSVAKREDNLPARNPNRISEEKGADPATSPIPKTPEDKLGSGPPASQETPNLRIDTDAGRLAEPEPEPQRVVNGAHADSPTQEHPDGLSESKDLTLFLQLGRSIKKVVLADGAEDLSIASLRLQFISKFNYSPPSGDDFPEIYLQDPVSGVRYELEDLRDVKDRSVLCLNIEILDEVKRHIDDGMEGLKKLVQGLAGSVESQASQITRVAERQEEAAKKIVELSVTGAVGNAHPVVSVANPMSRDEKEQKLAEVRTLRKDLAVLRQVYSGFVSDMNASMASIKEKAASVKQTATVAALSSDEGRSYVEKGKSMLNNDADVLVNRVDELQDIVEDLRKDVVSRGVRPIPSQLEVVSKNVAQAKKELKRMTDYIRQEKPMFRRVWERELEVVCEEQEFFNMQESLMTDLEDDLEKVTQTFVLVEQCSEQQLKAPANGIRSTSRGFVPPVDPENQLDPADAKDNVLNEVRALKPNHEIRLEAIERAEKNRKRDLETRVPEFQKELGKFVEENKLRKAGGVEETERRRKVRDEEARKAIWELKKQMEEAESSEEETSDEDDDEDDAA